VVNKSIHQSIPRLQSNTRKYVKIYKIIGNKIAGYGVAKLILLYCLILLLKFHQVFTFIFF
jgi:hypothetical protein